MQLVMQSLCLSYLMQNASIMTGLMKKCLLQLMAWVDMDGQIRNCFTAGWQTISWSMQLVPSHYCCCWMVTVHTTAQQQFALPKNMMLLCSASHHTPHMSHNLSTRVQLDYWSETGVVCATNLCNNIPAEAWMKSMVSANIVSRFKKCDVYPFNHDVIAIHTPNVASEMVLQENLLQVTVTKSCQEWN